MEVLQKKDSEREGSTIKVNSLVVNQPLGQTQALLRLHISPNLQDALLAFKSHMLKISQILAGTGSCIASHSYKRPCNVKTCVAFLLLNFLILG